MYSFNSSFKKRYKNKIITNVKKSIVRHNGKYNRNNKNNKNTPEHLNTYITTLESDKPFNLNETLKVLSQYYLTTKILTEKEKNIKNIIKHMQSKNIKSNITNPQQQISKTVNNYYVPKFNDTLLWCWIRFHYGTLKTEFVTNTGFKEEQKERIKLIQFIKENKSKLKKVKNVSANNSTLNLNNEIINLETLSTILYLHKYNLCIITKNTYFHIESFEEENTCIIYKSDNGKENYKLYEGKENAESILSKLKNTHVKIDNLKKPLGPISKYKINDLIQICETLKIEYKKPNNKNMLKKDIYLKIQEELF